MLPTRLWAGMLAQPLLLFLFISCRKAGTTLVTLRAWRSRCCLSLNCLIFESGHEVESSAGPARIDGGLPPPPLPRPRACPGLRGLGTLSHSKATIRPCPLAPALRGASALALSLVWTNPFYLPHTGRLPTTSQGGQSRPPMMTRVFPYIVFIGIKYAVGFSIVDGFYRLNFELRFVTVRSEACSKEPLGPIYIRFLSSCPFFLASADEQCTPGFAPFF